MLVIEKPIQRHINHTSRKHAVVFGVLFGQLVQLGAKSHLNPYAFGFDRLVYRMCFRCDHLKR